MLDFSENEKGGSTAWQSYVGISNQGNLCSSFYTSDDGILVRAKTSNIVYVTEPK